MLETEYFSFGVNTMPADALVPIGCVRQATCVFVPELFSSTWVKPNQIYNSKCVYMYILYNP